MAAKSLSPRLQRLLGALALLGALFALSCEQAPIKNPASLWISYSQLEINLVLVDHEPPPF